MSTELWVTTDTPGFHSWSNAPSRTSFLRFPHRHMFKFKAGVRVDSNDRELEFFDLQSLLVDQILALYELNSEGLGIDFGLSSCEQIAQNLLDTFTTFDWIEVSEDGESGSIVRVKHEEVK